MPRIKVEFFGVPRLKANVPFTHVEAENVFDMLNALAREVPGFTQACVNEGQLSPECLLSINGIRFTRDVSTPLREGDEVLILSADVGG
ncbi:MoaD/ThiS family protein [Thalassoglobus sp.]|uniref:MoaD/ThiS family protein n=1 Tax=Thalassoglobus sp. TaxID=2795869 RepID=UPI003AA9BCC2